MLTVAITAPIGAASIGTAGLMDALNKADNSWALLAGPGAPRLFDVCLVGLHGSGDNPPPVACRDGVLLQPRSAAGNLPTPDLVVVPGLDDDLEDSFVRNLAAKVLLADADRSSQLPYVAFGADRSHGDQLVHRIQQHIEAQLDQPLRTGELAAHFGLSSRTLCRRFQTATGRGPQAYLQHARVQQAKRLLETTDDPIDQIRRRVGYHDPAAFRRAFHTATGLTPSGYRHRYGLRTNQSPRVR